MGKGNYLKAENLYKSFGGLNAVEDLSFSIQEGTITSLIGPNGAGKSTVFNLITGFHKLDSGKIFFRGLDITDPPPHKIVNLGIVRTFQDMRIFNKLTVEENILLGMRETHQERLLCSIFWAKSKSARAKMTEKVEELMEFVGLKEVAGEIAENISYAEKKLVALARALATDAGLVMLDEPTAGLAQDSIERMMPLLRRLVEEGKTVFLVEHNMDVVISISDYVIVLDFGKKIAEDTAEEIQSNNKVIQVYLGIS